MKPLTLILLFRMTAAAQLRSPIAYCESCDGREPPFSSRIARREVPGKFKSIPTGEHILLFWAHDSLGRRKGTDSELIVQSTINMDGSSSTKLAGTVLALSKERLSEEQHLQWTIVGRPPWYTFDAKTRKLTIRAAHYLEGDAHCCVSAVDIVTYRWDGTHFIEAEIRTELSEHGRAEGKTLPLASR